jgi:hypothetical protein
LWSAERKAGWFGEVFRVGVRFERKPVLHEQKEAIAV